MELGTKDWNNVGSVSRTDAPLPEKSEFLEARKFLPGPIAQSSMEKITLKDTVWQVIAACIAFCIVIQAGVNMAYSTILMRGLELSEETLRADEDERSWIASLVTISLPIGSLIVGPLMDKFGRKIICLISVIPAILSWALIIAANSLTFIYTARIVAGIGGGLTTVALVYVAEITHPQVRPMLLCLNSVFVSLGILIPCCLVIILDWRQMAIVFLGLNTCIFTALLFVPESPYWLLCFKNGMLNGKRLRRAENSLKWLNRKEIIYEREFARIKEVCQSQTDSSEKPTKSAWKAILSALQFFVAPNIYKPIIVLFCIFLLQQLSGCYVVIFYAISVFNEIGGTFGEGLDENGALVMLGVIRFVMSILTVFFSKKYGRRMLCICSSLGMAFSMFFSAMYMYLTSLCDENGGVREIMADQKWIVLVLVLFYVCMSSIGFMVIPWTLIGELLPVSVRGIAGGLMVAISYLMMSGVVKCYPYVLKVMTVQGIFFFFSFVSLLGSVYVYLFLPETLGKSFADIERHFINRSVVPKKPSLR